MMRQGIPEEFIYLAVMVGGITALCLIYSLISNFIRTEIQQSKDNAFYVKQKAKEYAKLKPILDEMAREKAERTITLHDGSRVEIPSIHYVNRRQDEQLRAIQMAKI